MPDDGLVDFDDAGCAMIPLGSETPQCQDRLGNDTDGRVGFDCGASTNGGACVQVCDGGPFAGQRCSDGSQCEGGSCVAVTQADGHCNSLQDAKEKKSSGCGLGFELALALPLVVALRRRRRRDRG